MKPVLRLVRIAMDLFGTSTPLSDQDFKDVHLPSGEAILLQRAEELIDRGIVAKHGTKNATKAVDEQSFSLQKFFTMLAKGDTAATEILFAPPLEADPRWLEIQAMSRVLLNRRTPFFLDMYPFTPGHQGTLKLGARVSWGNAWASRHS